MNKAIPLSIISLIFCKIFNDGSLSHPFSEKWGNMIFCINFTSILQLNMFQTIFSYQYMVAFSSLLCPHILVCIFHRFCVYKFFQRVSSIYFEIYLNLFFSTNISQDVKRDILWVCSSKFLIGL